MQRRKFSREFKIEAVRLVRERGDAFVADPCGRPGEQTADLDLALAAERAMDGAIEPQGLNKANSSRSELLTIH
jgi:hypothetical protein